MAKILVVDDEEKIRFMIRKYAEFEGYEVDEATDGFEAVGKVKNEPFDLVVMDIMMPELDGFSATAEIRKFDENLPVILLSARGEEYDKSHGFELGVDDYVVKPFSVKELMYRIAAVLRRTSKKPEEKDVMKFGGLEIHHAARTVKVDGNEVSMSPKEYDLLYDLARNKGIALTREQIISEVWGYDYFGDDRTLDTHMKLLRKDLGPYQKYIVTLRGVGYRFEPENNA